MFSLLNHKEGVFVAMACLELHLKVAEREANSIVQDPHCTPTFLLFSRCSCQLVKSLKTWESRQETKLDKKLLFHLLSSVALGMSEQSEQSPTNDQGFASGSGLRQHRVFQQLRHHQQLRP